MQGQVRPGHHLWGESLWPSVGGWGLFADKDKLLFLNLLLLLILFFDNKSFSCAHLSLFCFLLSRFEFKRTGNITACACYQCRYSGQPRGSHVRRFPHLWAVSVCKWRIGLPSFIYFNKSCIINTCLGCLSFTRSGSQVVVCVPLRLLEGIPVLLEYTKSLLKKPSNKKGPWT